LSSFLAFAPYRGAYVGVICVESPFFSSSLGALKLPKSPPPLGAVPKSPPPLSAGAVPPKPVKAGFYSAAGYFFSLLPFPASLDPNISPAGLVEDPSNPLNPPLVV